MRFDPEDPIDRMSHNQHQAITCTHNDEDLQYHMGCLGHNELTIPDY